MKNFNSDQLLFVGDIHGDFSFLRETCENVSEALIIQVGDCGLGFHRKSHEVENLKRIQVTCEKNNNQLILIRGNHDSKKRFQDFREDSLFNNIHLPEDYDVISWKDQKIQFVGGATSIDRTSRHEGTSYWQDEGVEYRPEKCQKVDILVCHTSPSWCFPQTFNEMVYGWAREDAYLIEDLNNERSMMDEICKKCNPRLMVYGHFHDSWSEEIENCRYRLMDINEVWEYRV